MRYYWKITILLLHLIITLTFVGTGIYCILFKFHEDAAFGLFAMGWIWIYEANRKYDEYKKQVERDYKDANLHKKT